MKQGTHQRALVVVLLLGTSSACTNPESGDGAVEDPSIRKGDGPWQGNSASTGCKADSDYVPFPGGSPRLTARQFNNTVHALFPSVDIPTQDFPAEAATGA